MENRVIDFNSGESVFKNSLALFERSCANNLPVNTRAKKKSKVFLYMNGQT
jgi:hypothetical protein